MANHTSLIFFLIFSISSVSTAVAYYPCDEYILALQWPKSFCLQPPKCSIQNIPNRFNIHGFWPNNRTTPTHKSCSDRSFLFYPPTRGMERWYCSNDLPQVWKNLKNGDDNRFWKTQWDKHGSCSAFNSAQEYFCTASQLYNSLKVNGLLGNLQQYSVMPAPYLPEQGQVHGYSVDELQVAFNNTLGGGNIDIFIECKFIKVDDKNGQPHVLQFLWETRVYIDPKKFTPIGSPKPFNNCKQSEPVYFP